jgi:SAM-dependent methyltransferase
MIIERRQGNVMTEQPQTWHYGLVARWWDEFNRPDPDELAFYRRCIADGGEPALDLACGTGRLLLPLLESGLDVDGCDLSPDMLALCRQRAEREGLAPNLYQQAFHALDLPRVYRTIFICDSFGIGGQREHGPEALRRCYRHLAPGGTFVFSHDLPDDSEGWPRWVAEQRPLLPEPWPESGDRKRAADGDEIELRSRLVDLDLMEQRVTEEIRALLWRGDEVLGEELHTIQISLYFRNELLQMLESEGFVDVKVLGAYSGEPATAGDTNVTFVARKPG